MLVKLNVKYSVCLEMMSGIVSPQVDRWPHNGYVKKLQRRDGCFYYFSKDRECPDKDIYKCKLYEY